MEKLSFDHKWPMFSATYCTVLNTVCVQNHYMGWIWSEMYDCTAAKGIFLGPYTETIDL